MISLRLPKDTENLIHLLSIHTGIPKNTLITQAVHDFLEKKSINDIPIKEKIKEPEEKLNLFNQEQMLAKHKGKELYKHLEELFSSSGIWTKNPKKTSAEITPGFYGRNTILGFTSGTGFDDTLIISKNHYPHDYIFGPLIRHRYELTSLSDWLEYMIKVNI